MTTLPRSVILLGMVSLLNDVASDMIAPLLPIFLTATLGAGPAIVGLIEGVAETTSSLVKLWSGRLGDRGVGCKRLAVMGYTLSNVVRPLLAFAPGWSTVLLLRFSDRIGKGVRTAPRDALISEAVDASQRGRAFGVHRAFDHSGAMLGPLLASVLLAFGMPLRDVFLVSVIPGVLAVVVLMLGVRETAQLPLTTAPPLRWHALHPQLRGLIAAAGALALASVPDAFLVLYLQQSGVSLFWIPLLWALAHGLRALVVLPVSRWSDRGGRLPVMLTGWLTRAALLAAMPWFETHLAVVALYLLYSSATALTEGAERALIGDLAAPDSKGTAFGLYHMTVGLLALPGALWFGVVWQTVNMHTAFALAATMTTLAALWLAYTARRMPTKAY